MSDLVGKFLSEDDKATIETKVRETEKRTAGEIVVMVVSSSHHYPLANILGGMLFGVIAGVTVSLVTGLGTMWHFLGFFVLAFVLSNEVIKRSFFLKRLFVAGSDMDEEVEEAAIGSFYKKEIYNTRNHTGILIYISLFEHRVWVFGDKGIDASVDKSVWQEITGMITAGIKDKRQVSAICRAVERCGDILEKHFPAEPDNSNELGDSVIIGH
jgi:putative membrane protein